MIKLPEIRKQVEQIINEIVEKNITMFSALPMKSQEGKDYEHAFDTAVLSLLIGQGFKYDKNDLRALGSAAMLHDIGKAAFGDLKNKEENKLTRDEKMLLREHPVYSMLILQGSEPDAFIELTTIFQHHEQDNGKGYPQGLKGFGKPPVKNRGNDKGYIYRMAEILAVADTYDNLTSGSYDGTPHSPEESIKKIINGKAGSWNKAVVHTLAKVVQCYPVGALVKIMNTYSKTFINYFGVIAKANTTDQSKPTIILTHNSMSAPITPRIVDFKDEKSMTIELIF